MPTRLLICPGIHNFRLTDSFIKSLDKNGINLGDYLVLPTNIYLPFYSCQILQFLAQEIDNIEDTSLIFLCFSAGVVGAIGTSWIWQQWGGEVTGFIALDGWGVPLFGNFPIYRLSHDQFTYWSSGLLGTGAENFYADPAVDHLTLWETPDRVLGWKIEQNFVFQERSQTTAADFLASLIDRLLKEN